MEFAIGQCAKKIHSWVGQTLINSKEQMFCLEDSFFFGFKTVASSF